MTDLEQRARDAISISAGDYERRAKVNRLAAEEDLPADFVDANLDYVEKEKLRKGLDLSGVPNTAGFYSAPSNAEVAGDDVDKFARWEREINTFDEGKFFGEHTLKLLSDATTNLGTSTLRGSANLIQGFKDTLVQGGFQSFEGGRERYKQYAAEEERKRAAGESVGILESFKQAENPYLFGEETTTPVDIKESFSEGEYMETAGNVGQFIYDTGVQSIPQMISYFTPLGVATSSIALTQNIAEKIAENNGEEVNAGHMVMAAPWSAASIMLDKYGLGLMTKAGKTEMELLKEVAGDLTAITARNAFGSAIKAGGKAAFGEGSTEFSQEIIEYVGERFGTEAKIDMAEAVEQGAWAFLAGGAMGGVIGTPAAYLNERERRIRAMKDKELQNDFDSLREQDLLDSVITQSQEFASVKRAPEVVEQFFQSVGGDKSVLIPQSVVRQAIAEGAEIPPVLTGKLDPTGLDIRVPLSEFVTQIATNPDLVNLLRPHMRMREDGVSLSDIESRINRPTIEAMLGRQDKVTRIQKENAEALKELEDGLVSTGMHSKNTARLVVRLYAEYADRVSTDLKNAGHDVEVKDVIERARLKFAGPKADLSGKWAFENAAKEMVNLGRIEKEDFQKLDVSVQRDMVAQFNAAKPKERGGLGLKADNTREERAKAMGRDLVDGEVYDPITTSTVNGGSNEQRYPTIQERKRKYAPQEGQSDLFDTSGLSGEEAKAQAIDNLYVRNELSKLHDISVGLDAITNAEEAAHVAAAFRKKSQETFVSIVTNGSGKIIEVIRHSIGGKAEASVYPADVAGAVMRVDGASNVWFVHNHPSGNVADSAADNRITDLLYEAFKGSSVFPSGHIITTSNGKSRLIGGGNNYTLNALPKPRGKKITVKERVIMRKPTLEKIGNPSDASRILRNISSENAIVLLNHQNEVTGFLTVTEDELLSLKDHKMVDRILSAIDRTNSSGIILKTTGGMDIKINKEPAENLSKFINRGLEIRFLDWVNFNDRGQHWSAAEHGDPSFEVTGTFKQETLPDKIVIDGVERHTRNSDGKQIAANEEGVRNFWAWFGESKVVDKEGRPLVVYHGGKEGIEEFDAGKAGSIQSSDWGRGIYFTPTEWVANSYKEDANKATNEAANAAWDAIEAKSKEYGTDPMYVSIHLNSKKITQEQYDEIKALEKEWRDALGEAKKVGGDVYAVYLRMEDPLYYTYDGITDHTLSMQAKAQGKDGLIVEPMTEYVVFDPTQIKSVANVGTFSGETANIYRQAAFHGSPYRFDKFSLDHMGKGEGAQAYGYGLYFAGDKEVAEYYRSELSRNDATLPPRRFFKGQELSHGTGEYHAARLLDSSTLPAARKEVASWIKDSETWSEKRKGDKAEIEMLESWMRTLEVLNEAKSKKEFTKSPAQGQLYRVEIPEDDTYLLWDKPLSNSIAEGLRGKLLSNGKDVMDSLGGKALGRDLYKRIEQLLDGQKSASEFLHRNGINGIKYLDGTSRGKGDGSYNYVIFDDAAIEIVETYYQQQGETQAVIHNFPFGDRVIQLFDKQNLSSVLHESAHLFLLMEADLAAEFGVTPKQEALLKWLGVESFDDIRRVHHEKFARTFEAYLFEGKAPSLALADVFSRMKEWMVRVYEFIRNIPEAQIDPEVREIFDRLLATDQKIEEMRANPAYDQFFSSKESAGMSQAEWEKYLEKVKRSESKAKETVDEKLLKEWKRYRMKEWIEERDVIRDNEEVILKGQPVYKAVEALKKGKLNRAQVEQLMNVDLDADKAPLSLLEFAKSIGGMNVDDFISHGVDPADMKVFPRGTFTKDGKTLGGFAEAAAEEGYIVGTSSYEETYEDSYDDNDFLDLVMREIHGEKAYTSEGMEYFAQKDADEKYQEDYFAEHGEYPAAPEETEQDKLIKKLKKMSKKDGLDIALFSADMGFESPRDMMDQVLSVRPVKEQAKENAQAAMLDKYGDSLRDDVLQEEVKEALANEDTAELVLMEINAMNRKVKRKSMDMEYIKQKARDLIAKMKKKEMRPSSYYNMMLKAAEKSKKANSEAAKINAAIAVERSKAAEELMAEVSEQAKEAKVEYDKAEKDYKEKAESARDVSRDKAVAKKKYDEAKKISDEARKQADELIKATEKAKKKSAKKPGDIALKAEYDALVESRDVAKKSAADAEKETAKFKSLMERLANDYNSLFDLQVAAKKVMDNQKKIMEEQGFRLEEKTGRAAELKTEAGKKLLDLEKDLDRVSKEAAEAKAQQLANHHLFKEATEAQKRIDTQVRYLRKVKAKTYNPKEVDPDYIAQAKALINLFDMKHYKAGMTAEEKSQHQADMDRELDRILTWYESQVMSTEKLNELNQDENGTGNRNTLQWLSEDLVAALAAKKEASDKGVPFTFKMTNIEDMTAGQIQGLYDTIKNIRLVGGKNSEYSKAEYQREQESIGEEVKEHSTKTITPTMEPTLMEGAKRTFKAEWSSMRNIHGILYTLAGGNPDSKLMKAYESIVDAVNRHITLEHDFAKVINDAMGPILRTMANPFNHNYTKADGKVWSLSNQARFTLLMNMGNQSNLDALILGFNNTYPEMGVFTHADLLGMVSGMGKPVYEAANKIWAYKDSVTWPLSSAIQRKVDGVTTAKIDPVPFVVDGFSLTGGHYRLHYIPLEGEGVGKDIGEETHASKTMNMGKIASQFSRVGSGGRAVDIGTFHLYRDIDEELRFIAYKELTIKMSRMFNGVKNPLRGAIVRHYGREYMQNLEDTIGRMVNPQVVKSGAWAKIGRYVRTNMVYAFLAFSIRNVMQATYSFATGAAQLGGADYVIWSLLKFYSNPMENFKEVHESSAYMRDRVVFINHETMTQMSRLSMWSPLMTPLKKVGWSLHAVVDGMQAYPYWMEAKRQYLRDNQVTKDTDFKAREKAANDYADLTVKQIMGSGHPLDIGSAFTNPDELHKNLVFMGAFANTTYNANAHNIEAFKRGKIPWYELARRLGWYTVLGPIMVMGVLGQLAPEEDEDEEDFWKRIMSGILGYNAGQVIGLGHLSNIFLNDRGFDLPMFQAIESAKSVGKIAGQVYGDVTGEEDIEFDARMQARLVRSLSMMFPIFGASQWAKLIEGYDDDNQDFWGMLVEGKQK